MENYKPNYRLMKLPLSPEQKLQRFPETEMNDSNLQDTKAIIKVFHQASFVAVAAEGFAIN